MYIYIAFHPLPLGVMHARVILQPDKLRKRGCKCSHLILLLFQEVKLGYFASNFGDGCAESCIVDLIK